MKQLFICGVDSLLDNGTTQYNSINGGYLWTSSNTFREQMISAPGTFKNFKIELNGSPGTDKSYTFTIIVNGTASNVTVTISDSNTTGVDTVNTISVVAGDLIQIKCVPSNSPSLTKVGLSTIFQGTDATESLIIGGGASFYSSSSDTVYNWLDNMYTWTTDESNARQVVSSAGTIKKLYIKLSLSPGTGKSFTFTVMKNSVAQSLEVTISNSNTTGNDTSNTVSIVAGDKISIRCVPSGTPRKSFVDIGEVFIPTTVNEFMFLNTVINDTNISTTEYNYFSMRGGGLWISSESNRNHTIGQDELTLKRLYIELENAPGSGNSFKFTLRKNQSSTPLTVTISDANTTGNDTSNEILVSDFDNLSIECDPTGTPVVGSLYWGITGIAVTPTDQNISEIDVVVTDSIVLSTVLSVSIAETITVTDTAVAFAPTGKWVSIGV